MKHQREPIGRREKLGPPDACAGLDSRTDMPDRSSDRLKVALVDLDGQPVPGWVRESLHPGRIELTIHDCTSREEVAQHAADADIVWLFGGSRILQGNLDVLQRCFAIIRTGSG